MQAGVPQPIERRDAWQFAQHQPSKAANLIERKQVVDLELSRAPDRELIEARQVDQVCEAPRAAKYERERPKALQWLQEGEALEVLAIDRQPLQIGECADRFVVLDALAKSERSQALIALEGAKRRSEPSDAEVLKRAVTSDGPQIDGMVSTDSKRPQAGKMREKTEIVEGAEAIERFAQAGLRMLREDM